MILCSALIYDPDFDDNFTKSLDSVAFRHGTSVSVFGEDDGRALSIYLCNQSTATCDILLVHPPSSAARSPPLPTATSTNKRALEDEVGGGVESGGPLDKLQSNTKKIRMDDVIELD